LAIAPPFVAQAMGTFVGAGTMFTQVERYHIEIALTTSRGTEPLPLHLLAPHLSRDARIIVLPAESHGVGASQVAAVRGGLGDLARLACAVRVDASAVAVTLERDAFDGKPPTAEKVERACR
jgi:hypothetical protein